MTIHLLSYRYFLKLLTKQRLLWLYIEHRQLETFQKDSLFLVKEQKYFNKKINYFLDSQMTSSALNQLLLLCVNVCSGGMGSDKLFSCKEKRMR